MEIRFTPYALEQLRERELAEVLVREALANPGQLVGGKKGRIIAQTRIRLGGKEQLLRVIYEEAGASVLVITAYTTSKVSKYWRTE